MRSLIAVTIAATAGCTGSGATGSVPPQGTPTGMSSVPSAHEGVTIREFPDLPVYYNNYYPNSITQAAGSLWVTDDIDQDAGACAVVRIAPSGKQQAVYYVYGQYSEGTYPEDITAGPDGALWIADSFNWQLIRMTTHGEWTSFPLGSHVGPLRITTGGDKALWFTFTSPDIGTGIGRLTLKARVRFYQLASGPEDVAAGPDGALWFTQPGSDQIGRITTHGKVTEYSNGITPGAQPFSINPGPDGALWFTELHGGRIGRITTTGNVTEYSRGITSGEDPIDLAAGRDGAIWFTEYEGYGSYGVIASKIGRITMNGKITQYAKGLNPVSGPTGIAAGPGRTMWFVETNVDKTGRVTF